MAGNRVFANSSEGIHHEISYDAVIRYNTVFANGYGYDSWLYGAQILISTSQNVEIYDNKVEVASGYGDGIALIQQERGVGPHGEWRTSGNHVHNNIVIYHGENGVSGAVGDYNNEGLFSGGNRFYNNSYQATRGDHIHWAWGEEYQHRARYRTWLEMHDMDQELDGRLDVRQSEPLAQICEDLLAGSTLD